MENNRTAPGASIVLCYDNAELFLNAKLVLEALVGLGVLPNVDLVWGEGTITLVHQLDGA